MPVELGLPPLTAQTMQPCSHTSPAPPGSTSAAASYWPLSPLAGEIRQRLPVFSPELPVEGCRHFDCNRVCQFGGQDYSGEPFAGPAMAEGWRITFQNVS